MSPGFNSVQLRVWCLENQVYGVRWCKGGPEDYVVYQDWNASADQLLEMLTYEGIDGLQRC